MEEKELKEINEELKNRITELEALLKSSKENADDYRDKWLKVSGELDLHKALVRAQTDLIKNYLSKPI